MGVKWLVLDVLQLLLIIFTQWNLCCTSILLLLPLLYEIVQHLFQSQKFKAQGHWWLEKKVWQDLLLGWIQWNYSSPFWVNTLYMIDQAYIRRPHMPLNGFKVVSMVKEILSSLSNIEFPDHIVIYGCFLCFLFLAMSKAIPTYSSKLCLPYTSLLHIWRRIS